MRIEDCNIGRRDFLTSSLGGLVGLVVSSHLYPFLLGEQRRRKAKACILLWMAGGPSQLDTFDLKPGTETGGLFKEIPTRIPGIHISEHLPKLASQANHLAIIRSMTTKEGNHERATFLVHTGYSPQVTVQYPSLGAIMASELGHENFDLPHFISIGGPSTEAGFLGHKYNPFIIQNPAKPPENLNAANGVNAQRVEDRIKLLGEVEKEVWKAEGLSEVIPHQDIYKKALRMMRSPLTKAFDLSTEKESTIKSYGTSNFGQGCLLARRLVETGVRFVEVTLPGWDTHKDNFATNKKLMEQLDPGFSALISDLKDRGLLEETLVVWMGEFGRTPKINANSGRDHYPKAWSAVLAGGGVQGGKVIGGTDGKGIEIQDKPIKVPDLFASIAHMFGLDPKKQFLTPQGRPTTLIDKDAQIINDLFV